MVKIPKSLTGRILEVGKIKSVGSRYELPVKTSDQGWRNIARVKKSQLFQVRSHLLDLQKQNNPIYQNITPTTFLSEEQIRIIENGLTQIKRNHKDYLDLEDDNGNSNLAYIFEFFDKFYEDETVSPTVADAIKWFMESRIRGQKAKRTVKDYENFIEKAFNNEFGDRNVNSIRARDIEAYLETINSVAVRNNFFRYFRSFWNWVENGKRNSYQDGVIWIPVEHRILDKLNRPQKIRSKPIIAYDYEQLIKYLKISENYSYLSATIFRLFSLCRFSEYQKFVQVSKSIKNNPNIDHGFFF